ncbi:MAG: hypothetical protein Q4E99_01510 [Bacillota bacterium]|nr:hypothetical protein [Bacillota bacterium]
MNKKIKNSKSNSGNSKFINAAFLAVLVLCSVLGFAFAVSGHTDTLEYENRTASKIGGLTFSSFFDGTFQDNFEKSFADQAFGSNGIKHRYNIAKSTLIENAIKPLAKYEENDTDTINHEILVVDSIDIGGSEITPGASDVMDVEDGLETKEADDVIQPADEPIKTEPTNEISEDVVEASAGAEKTDLPVIDNAQSDGGKYYSVGGGMYRYGDYVVQGMVNFKGNQSRFDKFFSRYNELIADHPDINFYIYYIERDSDQNYATGKRAGISEYIKSSINLPETSIGIQEVRDFDTYKEYNYKSDHHWAYKGSYAGYTDILSMLKPNEAPMEILGEYKIGTYKGSFSKTDATANVYDDFYAYELPFPKMEVKFNNKTVSDYGSQASYIAKAKEGND